MAVSWAISVYIVQIVYDKCKRKFLIIIILSTCAEIGPTLLDIFTDFKLTLMTHLNPECQCTSEKLESIASWDEVNEDWIDFVPQAPDSNGISGFPASVQIPGWGIWFLSRKKGLFLVRFI